MILDKISNRLELTLVNSNNTPLYPKSIQVVSVLKEVYFINKFEARRVDQNLKLEIKDSSRIVIDPTILFDIIDKLVKNAIKFSSPGDTTTLILSIVNNNLFIEVIDQGKGLSTNEIARIENMPSGYFMQSGVVNQHRKKGVGLFLVRQMLNLYDGTLRIESKGRQMGCRFCVCIPIKNEMEISTETEIVEVA